MNIVYQEDFCVPNLLHHALLLCYSGRELNWVGEKLLTYGKHESEARTDSNYVSRQKAKPHENVTTGRSFWLAIL